MKDSAKLKKAFEKLAKKYPAAAKELAKEFTAAIGMAAAKAKLAAAKAKADAAKATQVHTITVQGCGSDGKIYEAVFEAVFPQGTRILGVKNK